MGTLPVNLQRQWKQAYTEALLELEPRALRSKLNAAEKAVEDRLLELGSRQGKDRRPEILELTYAQRVLRYLSGKE